MSFCKNPNVWSIHTHELETTDVMKPKSCFSDSLIRIGIGLWHITIIPQNIHSDLILKPVLDIVYQLTLFLGFRCAFFKIGLTYIVQVLVSPLNSSNPPASASQLDGTMHV